MEDEAGAGAAPRPRAAKARMGPMAEPALDGPPEKEDTIDRRIRKRKERKADPSYRPEAAEESAAKRGRAAAGPSGDGAGEKKPRKKYSGRNGDTEDKAGKFVISVVVLDTDETGRPLFVPRELEVKAFSNSAVIGAGGLLEPRKHRRRSSLFKPPSFKDPKDPLAVVRTPRPGP